MGAEEKKKRIDKYIAVQRVADFALYNIYIHAVFLKITPTAYNLKDFITRVVVTEASI